MNILKLAIVCFCFMEVTNVMILYFFPNSKKANGAGVFRAWEKSKQDPEIILLF